MPLVKFLNGELVEFNATDAAELTLLIAEEFKTDPVCVCLTKNSDEDAEISGISFFVTIDESKTFFIVNLTQKNYFSYERAFYEDKGYNQILADLLSQDPQDLTGVSHWLPTDKIVFAPENTKEHVKNNYGQLKI